MTRQRRGPRSYKNLNHSLKSEVIDGNDSIKIFYFLTSFVKEDRIFHFSEAKAFNTLPKFLADPAETHFRTKLIGASLHGGIRGLTEAIKYIFRTFSTLYAMCEILNDLLNVKQKGTEKKNNIGST